MPACASPARVSGSAPTGARAVHPAPVWIARSEHAPVEAVETAGAEDLRALLTDRFVPPAKPVYGVYRMRSGGRAQTGLVAAVPVLGAGQSLLRPHERTRTEREDELLARLERLRAETGPVSLAYRPDPLTRRLFASLTSPPATLGFVTDGVEHELWTIVDREAQAELTAAFGGLEALYVIDGHHRTVAAARCAQRQATAPDDPAATMLSVLFPADEVHPASFHRCVRSSLPADELLGALRERMSVRPAPAGDAHPPRRGVVSMWLEGRWHHLEHGVPDANDALVLQEEVLAGVLGITDPSLEERLRHVPPTVPPEELAGGCAGGGEVAFVLHPPGMSAIMAAADAGERLPPKSTWFAPKPRPGVIVRLREVGA